MRQINSDRAERGKTAEKTSNNKSNKVYNCEQQSKYKTQKNFHLGQSQIRIQETQLQLQIQIQSQTQLQIQIHSCSLRYMLQQQWQREVFGLLFA